MSKENNTFCIVPWVHLHVAQNGNIIPCCQAPPHKVHRFGTVNEESISAIWQGEAIRQFRQKMLNGESDVRCKQCYLKEAQGWQSMRLVSNKKYSAEAKEVQLLGTNAHAPVYFDFRFSNACNLKCRICGPWASSQWYKDAVALGMKSEKDAALTLAIKDETAFFEELTPLLSTAKEFYFAGGEPLMMQQHYKVLDALLQCGNTEIQLAYNTNFSVLSFKDYKVVDYWKKFKNVSISASLDAEGERGELLRKNLNWNRVLENRKILLKELPHVNFQVTPTVCLFNVAHLPNFHKNWVEQSLIKVEDFLPNVLVHPKEYSINVLPMDVQLKLKENYEQHLAWMQLQASTDKKKFNLCLQQFESIVQQLGQQTKPELIELVKEKTTKLDALRKENLASTFPELSTFK